MTAASARVRFTERRRREALQDAVEFLAERYELGAQQRAALSAVPVRWRRGGRRSTFRAPRDGGPGSITVSLPRGPSVRWHVYRRVRAGLVTPHEGVEMDLATFARLVLVHELTHALQHGTCGGPRRRFSEVETTRNEIEFLRRIMPEACARLVPVHASRRGGLPVRASRVRSSPTLLDRLLGWLRGERATCARARRCRAVRGLRPAPGA